MHHPYTYLALGDSYTIGEAVLLHQNFPYQAVQLLREKGYAVAAPEIIAKTGWTTDELEAGMQGYHFQSRYDIVSLLIGVNNQYRGRDTIEYKTQLESLLQKAIQLAGDKPAHVYVLSIPDYSATPFTASMDRLKITREIDIFNNIKKALSLQYKTQLIDITPGSREAANDPSLVAADQLHPSDKEYRRWAEKLSAAIHKQLK